jgi:adenylate cyclase
VGLLLIGAVLFASRQLFLDGLFVSPLYGVLTTLLCGGTLLCLRFWQEEKQKLLLRGVFSRYVSPEVVKRITRERGDLFAGEERELSILFTDIRGFTTLSESLSPQDVVRLLNRYFTPMTALVRDRQGTLDKFIGDALMAFWNAPLAVPGHPALAVDAALAMQEKLAEMNGELEADFGIRLAMGAGIHTGMAYVGNMGSDDLVNYTLIGDSVNLTSRLEGLCKHYGVPVVVSGEVAEQCEQSGAAFSFQYLDSVQVKGREKPVAIYQPMRGNTDFSVAPCQTKN